MFVFYMLVTSNIGMWQVTLKQNKTKKPRIYVIIVIIVYLSFTLHFCDLKIRLVRRK